ncbi:hypothetical protein ASL14_08385 [Paenibacillus sp. IHB B 3084]|uniref:ABC-three component system protein n=1 Tax=Paenibacillus TaxID=44249 RepID=UPI0007223B48|nr:MULTISPECIES: ABC-three component system protein [Paenibacillus]ALP36182.1 hypothetical protein ASL14_08385 [Paenibacillus sp. IHB B 3084]
MNRSRYFDYIEEKLNTLATRINSRGKINILDLHIHSEDFYLNFMNLLYGWKLVNLNNVKQNVEGIDLIDDTNKLIVQVSSTSTKQKVNSALNKEILSQYSDYRFKFISISKDATSLRSSVFENPFSVDFTPENDILDTQIVLRDILSSDIEVQKRIYDFIKKELGRELDIVKLDSNLATIINILSKENFTIMDNLSTINSFEIDNKIVFNELTVTKMIIDDYKIHYGKLDKKYKEFDKQGSNKSFAVLQFIRKQYIKLCSDKSFENSDLIFLKVIEELNCFIKNNNECADISFEELDLCVNILVVDAFIRCKIFENPEGYDYVTSR